MKIWSGLWLLAAMGATFAHGGEAVSAKIVQQTPLEYPPAEEALGHEGEVYLSVQVRSDGSVGAVEILKSSGWLELDAAATRSVATWKYSPALDESGRPVASNKRFAVRYAFPKPEESEERLQMLLNGWSEQVELRQFGASVLSLCELAGVLSDEARLAQKQRYEALSHAIDKDEVKIRQYFFTRDSARADADLLTRRQSVEARAKQRAAEVFKSWSSEDKSVRCRRAAAGDI